MKIEVRCPSCSKIGYIDILEETIKNIKRGVLSVNIAKDTVCEHSFIAYVDKNLVIRDYILADFHIELPDAITEQELKQKISITPDLLDIDLIKLNLHASLLTFIIRGIILKKKIILVSDLDFLLDHITNFFKYITQNSFDFNIFIVSKGEYEENKKEYKNHLVFESNHIINDKNKLIDPKKLKIEQKIFQKFYADNDSNSSVIILKNEVQKAYLLSKTVVDYINNIREKEKLSSKKIIDKINEVHGIKIQIPYFNFLIDIVKNYFEVDVPKLSDVSNFLGFL
ncbi:MAG: hypothetical protein ACTSRI_09905 [Promethearchaeota archaeon]